MSKMKSEWLCSTCDQCRLTGKPEMPVVCILRSENYPTRTECNDYKRIVKTANREDKK